MLSFAVGLASFAAAAGMLLMAKPVDGRSALFLRGKETLEIAYTFVILVLLVGGMGGLLLGATSL